MPRSETLLDMEERRRQWLRELREAQKKPRVLFNEDPNGTLPSWETECCVICKKRTTFWLMPENAPLHDGECLEKYLKDPSVYDPRGLHNVKVIIPPKQPRRRPTKPKRWEPSEEEVEVMQKRIAKQRRGDDDGGT